MSKIDEELKDLEQALAQARDELRVDIHLAKADIRDDWEELERQWEHFKQKMKRVGHEAAEAGEDIGEATSLLGAELRNGYRRLRKAMQRS
jgi:predicted  nucleic acid-binding Zn-ribbon protein